MRMIKRLLILTFSVAALWLVPVTASAAPAYFAGSPEQKIELNIPKGCYIVKVGKVVRRVYVR